MGNVLIEENTLLSIAEQVRSALGTSEKMLMSEVPNKIEEIASRGGASNGKEWEKITELLNAKPSFYYCDGLWVSAGNKGIFYSEDGLNWTKSNITSSVSSSDYSAGICCHNGFWVITGKYPYYSTDGKEWTKGSEYMSCSGPLYYVKGVWVTSNNSGIYYSTDGINWTKNSLNLTKVNLKYANDLLVAISPNGMYYSTDGINWTKNNNFPSLPHISSIEYAKGLWVISCGQITDNKGIYYSEDGINWTEGNMEININLVYYAKGLWLASGTYNTYYSTDGLNWTEGGIGSFASIIYANKIWVATHASGGIYYSEDGINWTNCLTQGCKSLYYSDGVWLAGGYNSYYSRAV